MSTIHFYIILFSTHILTRRMTDIELAKLEARYFSTHILTSRMTTQAVRNAVDRMIFQLTSSQGGWPGWLWPSNPVVIFQLTSSQGGWHRNRCGESGKRQFFNSHPHKEDDRGAANLIYSIFFQLTSSQGGWPVFLRLFHHSLCFSTHILIRRMTAILNKNTLSKTARIIPFEYNTLKIYIFSNSYLLFFWKSTPFSSANLPEDFCALIIRTKISKYP